MSHVRIINIWADDTPEKRIERWAEAKTYDMICKYGTDKQIYAHMKICEQNKDMDRWTDFQIECQKKERV